MARIADFQKAYPEARVEMTETQDRDAKLVAAITAGTPPDVSVYDRYTIAGAQARGLFRDLQPLARTAGIKGEDQQPWCWEEVFREGKLWGLPYSTDTRMVYVNAAHLKQAGVPLTAPKTLDEFDRIMRQLTVGRPGSLERLGFVPWGGWNNWRLFGWGWLHGGDWYDAKANRVTMDHPRNIAALEWQVARANELGGFAGAEAFRAAQPKTGTMDLLKAGTLSAVINSTSQLIGMFAEKDLDWIVWAPPPAPGVDRTHTWSGGFANVLPTGVKNPDASFELARFLSDEEFQRVQSKTGAGACRRSSEWRATPTGRRSTRGSSSSWSCCRSRTSARRSCRSRSSTASSTARRARRRSASRGRTTRAPRWPPPTSASTRPSRKAARADGRQPRQPLLLEETAKACRSPRVTAGRGFRTDERNRPTARW